MERPQHEADGTSVRRCYQPLALAQVTLDDGFWAPRQRTNREATLPHVYRALVDTGRIDALRLTWKPGDGPPPHVFWDSDVAKWLEAASYSLATHPDPSLAATVDQVIELLAAAQQPDGYLNSHFSVVEPEQRWSNLRDLHELYCAGHLIEAGVAHSMATGQRTLLDVVRRYADYIGGVFGTGAGQKRGYCGHEEIELALVKLYRATGDQRYLDLSRYFVDERGRQPHYFDLEAQARGEDPAAFWAKSYEYNQAHIPVREQRVVVGHAVRAMYLYSAMADLAGETGDGALLDACRALWSNLTTRRLYLTGGIGPSRQNEGFTADYDLPNESAYAETCAAIGLVLWAHRMLQLDCDGQYADVLERALYNGVLSGIALDGTRFFYENPLASRGQHARQPWYTCACCPPNIARLLASLGAYIYAQSNNEAVVHLYVQSNARLQLDNGEVRLRQETQYPWDGRVVVHVDVDHPGEFALRLRIPGWSDSAGAWLNGQPLDLAGITERGYAVIRRAWSSGDQVELRLAMPVQLVYAHPDVRENIGRMAIQRGPLVYCLEAPDNHAPVHQIALLPTARWETHHEPALLGGVTLISGEAMAIDSVAWGESLYRVRPPRSMPCTICAIPYYAWNNRGSSPMQVWLPGYCAQAQG